MTRISLLVVLALFAACVHARHPFSPLNVPLGPFEGSFADSPLVHPLVKRTITASDPFVSHLIEFSLANTGDEPTPVFHFALPEDQGLRLSSMEVHEKEKAENGLDFAGPFLHEINDDGEKEKYFVFEIGLKGGIRPMETRNFIVSLHFIGAVEPKPASVPQKQPQILFLRESHFFCSPYYVDEQRTRIKLGTTKVLSFTDLSPSKLKDRVLTLGPYREVDSFVDSFLEIYMESNIPILRVSQLDRTMWVSFWGKAVYVKEEYEVHNDGASVEGEFSRLDYLRGMKGNSVDSFALTFPASYSDFYYVDAIGKISTMRIDLDENSSTQTVHLGPRFPLMGGWKIKFALEYTIPLDEIVRSNGETLLHELQISQRPMIPSTSVSILRTKVMLPTMAHMVDMRLADVKKNTLTLEGTDENGNDMISHAFDYSYFDWIAREVISFNSYDFVPSAPKQDIIMSFSCPMWVASAGSAIMWMGALLVLGIFAFVYRLLFVHGYAHEHKE
eukprot:TRINITY_DN81742_c0_g1_i1.p1 TRINITY_DN81742_c0_g1~~TRINITY_DN81742_c0_g1_i1.p1  ORF type:complete len:502 (+),score=116.32 TRINITY_DN81742_c0_g1_i1:143-1648(+)